MDDFILEIYVNQIKDQINEAEKAFSDVLLNKSETSKVFSDIHHFIIHASHVFRLIHPKCKNDSEFKRYREVRLSMKFPKLPTSDTASQFGLRNDYEHFDERIDDWVVNSKNYIYVDKNIAPPGEIVAGENKDNFRLFDENTMTLYFAGKSYELNKIYQYIQDVKVAITN